MTVKLIPRRIQSHGSPLPYTGNPFRLCWNDILLFLQYKWSLVGILFPWTHWSGGDLDELYPSTSNVICLCLHGILIILQIAFIISLPFLVMFPFVTILMYTVAIMVVNFSVCWVLNGDLDKVHRSRINLSNDDQTGERWIYLNGVSVGKHWFQGNLDRLALTFGRPILGVHNPTYGIVFDLIQCVLERNFCYPTYDARRSYAMIKKCLLEDDLKKIILILHSQGGIQGSLILDWLYAELDHVTLQKLEVYTFASAANHFNNPDRSLYRADDHQYRNHHKAIRHIEHYAHDGDFVSRWGVLSFHREENRYMGRVFVRSGMGHLLNQHFLNALFPLGDDKRVMENNSFMDGEVIQNSDGAVEKAKASILVTILNGGAGAVGAIVEDTNSPITPVSGTGSKEKVGHGGSVVKVKDFSRLWNYRNGRSP